MGEVFSNSTVGMHYLFVVLFRDGESRCAGDYDFMLP
jgi:hypothetical protein